MTKKLTTGAHRAGLISALMLLFGLFMCATSAFADKQDYTEAAFAEAGKTGKLVVLDFYAPWSTTCREQAKGIDELLKDPAFSTVKVLVLDFDTATDLRKKYEVGRPSTLILLKNEKERQRESGITDPAELKQFIGKAMKE